LLVFCHNVFACCYSQTDNTAKLLFALKKIKASYRYKMGDRLLRFNFYF